MILIPWYTLSADPRYHTLKIKSRECEEHHNVTYAIDRGPGVP